MKGKRIVAKLESGDAAAGDVLVYDVPMYAILSIFPSFYQPRN